jgi:nucleotide-binding universal stress UspA family protein
MNDFRRILCPTDFSQFSARALAHAVALARWYESKVALLHVAPPVPPLASLPPVFSPAVPMRPPELPRAELECFAAPARRAGLDPELELVEGAVAPEILDRAEAMGADLIVMGTHGRGGFERLALGSITDKVMRRAPCPVLAVSGADATSPHEPPLFRRILCPLDFSQASRRALDYALSLAQQAQARLTLLHVLEWTGDDVLQHHRRTHGPEYERELEEDALGHLAALVPEEARNWCQVQETLAHGKAWHEIVRVAREQQAELVVMGVQGKGSLDRMLFGSTTYHVIREAACPVLAVRG